MLKELDRSSVIGIRLLNVSDEKDTLSLMVRYKNNKEYLHTMHVSTFLSDGISLRRMVDYRFERE